jgi:uncharacterized protein YceK
MAGPRQEQEWGKIYGGVRFECEAAQSLFAKNNDRKVALLYEACALAVDMPLCAVGDTLTLPLTVSYTLECQALTKEQEKVQESGGPAPFWHRASPPDSQ